MPLYAATSTLHTPSKGEPLAAHCTAYLAACVQCLGFCQYTLSLSLYPFHTILLQDELIGPVAVLICMARYLCFLKIRHRHEAHFEGMHFKCSRC